MAAGIDLRILIPVLSVIGALTIVTVTLLILVLLRSYKRRHFRAPHGRVEEDHSSNWSTDGLCGRGPSVREGRLVRHPSRAKLKDGGTKTTIEMIQEEHQLFSTYQSMSQIDESNVPVNNGASS